MSLRPEAPFVRRLQLREEIVFEERLQMKTLIGNAPLDATKAYSGKSPDTKGRH